MMSKECCRLDHLDGIPDRPHLIFWLELKSKIFVLRFFPRLKPTGVLANHQWTPTVVSERMALPLIDF
jgi:hypothetical protein